MDTACLTDERTNSFSQEPDIDTLRDSIFIPRFITRALPSIPIDHTKHNHDWDTTDHPRQYGTREQTVILVNRETGKVLFVERTLWNENIQPLSKEEGETRIEFYIEGYDD
jgi:uncharacterized protein with NRDE domain